MKLHNKLMIVYLTTIVLPIVGLTKTPQFEALSPLLNKTGDAWKQAIYSKSDAEALKIINDYRDVLRKTGLQQATDAANAMAKGKDINKIVFPN